MFSEYMNKSKHREQQNEKEEFDFLKEKII